MDFEPPSFCLGFDGLEDLLPLSPPLTPVEAPLEPTSVGVCNVPERTFKRLRRVVQATGDGCHVPNVPSEPVVEILGIEQYGGQIFTQGTRVSPEDDDIEDFSDEEARTGCRGGSQEKTGRAKYWEKSPLPNLRNQVTPAGDKAAPGTSTSSCLLDCTNKQSTMSEGRTRTGIEHFKTATGYSRPSYARKSSGQAARSSGEYRIDREVGWLGSKQPSPAMEHSNVKDGTWGMRQPNFDDPDAASRGVNAVQRTGITNGGCRRDSPSDWHHGAETSFPSLRRTHLSEQVRQRSDIIDLEAESDDESRNDLSDIENIRPTSSGQAVSTDFYPMCKGDLQTADLLRKRLSNFTPVAALATEGCGAEPVFIDYRNQFDQGARTKQSAFDAQNQQICAKKSKGRGQGRKRKTPLSQPTPQTGATSGKGYWTTEKAGNRIYVTQDGRKLSGQIAYRQHLKENGKKGKKVKPTASRASKK